MKVHVVEKARPSKRTRKCRTCGHEIQVGEKYRYFKKRYGGFSYYCAQHTPRPSEMTTGKAAQLLSIGEDLEDAIADATCPADVRQALEDAQQAAQELAEEYEESASNMEDGLGHETSMSEELRSKGEEIAEWADELEKAVHQIEDDPEKEDDESEEAYQKRLEEATEEAVSIANDAESSFPG